MPNWYGAPSYLYKSEDASVQQQMQSLKIEDSSYYQTKKPFRFFDLPREIRDVIYELALVQHPPVELVGLQWYSERYQEQIAPAAQLLRTSKQICEEATPIWYGQPFRFSNQSGWIVLGQWLDRIGAKNCALLKDITVCHTVGSTTPPYYNNGNGPDLRYDLLAPFGLGATPTRNTWSMDPKEMRFGDTMEVVINYGPMLESMPGLRHLRLVLEGTMAAREWDMILTDCMYKSSIFSLATRYIPAAELQLIHLVSYRPETRLLIGELAMTEIDKPTDVVWQDPDPASPHPQQSPQHSMRRALQQLRSQKISMVEQLYDQHRQYPVMLNQPCSDPGMCDYMWNKAG
ncbi:hypothetical protein LTR17_000562 [Elasticomyces elasticus]|nr:hypothetical protein LTR17_000562 [Elasticomyces elasticus]